MHPLRVVTIAQYLTVQHQRQQDYEATKFIKAVKGEPFGGWATLTVRGTTVRLEASNAHEACGWAAIA